MPKAINTAVLQFFGIARLPFSKIHEANQTFISSGFEEALARLEFAVAEEDFFLLTGAVGVGKSFVLNSLTSRLDPNCYTPIYIRGSHLSDGELYKAILAGLDRDPPRFSQYAKRMYFSVLPELTRKPIAIIDDAQDLQDSALTALKSMSNFGFDSQCKIAFILCGQPELRNRLKLSQFLPVLTRVRLAYHLKPMTLEETCRYIDHQTTAVGAPTPLFSDNAKADIHRRAEGIPRTVNAICFRSMIAAAADGLKVIDSSNLLFDGPIGEAER